MEFANYAKPIFGGMLLGISATILMLFNGKVAGISGIIGGLLAPKKNDISWRIIFLIGMFISAYILKPFDFHLPIITLDYTTIIIAGILIGFGAKLGNGCTSGHGIIGIGRFSIRSIVATLIFMFVAILAFFINKQIGIFS